MHNKSVEHYEKAKRLTTLYQQKGVVRNTSTAATGRCSLLYVIGCDNKMLPRQGASDLGVPTWKCVRPAGQDTEQIDAPVVKMLFETAEYKSEYNARWNNSTDSPKQIATK